MFFLLHLIYFSCCQESSNPVVVSSELNIKGGCAHTGENAGNRRKEAGEGGKVGEGEQSGEGGAEGKRTDGICGGWRKDERPRKYKR